MNRSFINLFGVTPTEFRRQFGTADMIQSGSGTQKEERLTGRNFSAL